MSVNLRIKVKLPQGTSKPDGIFRHWITPIVRIIDQEAKPLESLFKKSYANWKTQSKPVWNMSGPVKTFARLKFLGDLEGEFTTESVPYVFVSGGVDKLSRASFSKGYRPMTRPGALTSRPRQGRVVARGQGANVKRPIKARKFEDFVAKKRQSKFGNKVQPVIYKATRRILAVPGTGGIPDIK